MYILLRLAVTTWPIASKKKNLLTTKVFTSITELAAMTAKKHMMFRTRMMFKITYPGPATERLKNPILKKIED